MTLNELLMHYTLLALALIFIGSWFLMFAARMMRSGSFVQYPVALRINIYAMSIFWAVGVSAKLLPEMNEYNRTMSAVIALAASLLLIFRLVKDVSITKKVVIWFVWISLAICFTIAYTTLTCIR